MNNWRLLLCFFFCSLLSWGQSFYYPVPPDSIFDRQERINYMAEHFWNEQAVADTTCFQSPKLLLDYLYLLKQADEKEKCAQDFISLSCRQEKTFGLILYWLDNILYDSSSPHYDEPLYMKFLDAVISSDADSVMKLIPMQRKEIISKNPIGGLANNFSFIDKEGETNNLYHVEATFLLLIFNNPDCSLCNRAEEDISKNKILQRLLSNGTLKILAITPDAEYEEWMAHTYPIDWVVGYDMDHYLYNERLYDIQRLPCIYLLDKDKRILLKEADYGRLIRFFNNFQP